MMIRTAINDPNRPPGISGSEINWPKVTDADRAVGFFDLNVIMMTGATEKIRVFRLEPAEATSIAQLPNMVERFLGLLTKSVREPLETIAPPSYLLIYVIAHYLNSEASALAVMDPQHEFGQLLLEVIKPGLSKQYQGNPANESSSPTATEKSPETPDNPKI